MGDWMKEWTCLKSRSRRQSWRYACARCWTAPHRIDSSGPLGLAILWSDMKFQTRERWIVGGSAREMWGRCDPAQRLVQFVAIGRFDQNPVHPRLEAGIAILNQRIGGEREDWRVAAACGCLMCADVLGRF